MNTKQKAKELYDEFAQWVVDDENCSDELNKRFTKQCVKIHINQILKKMEDELEYYHAIIQEIDEI
jgi:hypothetical protein